MTHELSWSAFEGSLSWSHDEPGKTMDYRHPRSPRVIDVPMALHLEGSWYPGTSRRPPLSATRRDVDVLAASPKSFAQRERGIGRVRGLRLDSARSYSLCQWVDRSGRMQERTVDFRAPCP